MQDRRTPADRDLLRQSSSGMCFVLRPIHHSTPTCSAPKSDRLRRQSRTRRRLGRERETLTSTVNGLSRRQARQRMGKRPAFAGSLNGVAQPTDILPGYGLIGFVARQLEDAQREIRRLRTRIFDHQVLQSLPVLQEVHTRDRLPQRRVARHSVTPSVDMARSAPRTALSLTSRSCLYHNIPSQGSNSRNAVQISIGVECPTSYRILRG